MKGVEGGPTGCVNVLQVDIGNIYLTARFGKGCLSRGAARFDGEKIVTCTISN